MEDKMMETEILKTILASHGAVNTEYLLSNLGIGESATQLISNREKFVLCCPYGQPKVVARTGLRLCRAQSCPSTCKGLHLCRSFLLSGDCSFSQLRRPCRFSHDLGSFHNQMVLQEFELEGLTRMELCTLLMQSDNTLLPPMCFDYNNNNCQNDSCSRLHICEKLLNRGCNCYKNHDFTDPQPLKSLRDRGVPDSLFPCLKSIYANKEALRYADRKGDVGNQQKQQSSDELAALHDSDAGSNDGLDSHQREWHRGRGRGRGRGMGRGRGRGEFRGNRGIRGSRGHTSNRGNRGSRGHTSNRGNRSNQGNQEAHPEPTGNSSDSDIDSLDLYCDGTEDDFELLLKDEDAIQTDNSYNISAAVRGRVGNHGNRVNWGNRGNRQYMRGARSQSDIFAAAATAAVAGGDDEPSRRQVQKPVRGRGGNWGNRQYMQRARSQSDIFAAAATTAVAGGDDELSRRQVQKLVRDKTEICMYFIKGYCNYGDDQCYKVHDKMPYRWEVNKNGKWTTMPENEMIEKDYCDPKNTYSSNSPPVNFDTMMQEQNKVRRLSTVNSLLQPGFLHTTEWLWYWEDRFGQWNLYAAAAGELGPADLDSVKLEQKFLENDKAELNFVAGSQSYSLSFQDMIQTNKQYGTKRLVKRRPRFVSAADVLAKRVRKPVGQTNFITIPEHWDKSHIPLTGYRRVSLLQSSDEFKEIQALFCQTMRGYDILTIERIQNKSLWEAFQWQKKQMVNKNNGREVTEKKLFHGTDTQNVDDICLTNFDWTICGTHGTVYGKGGYFARDARYFDNHTGNSDVKSIFLARVLVGDDTKGSQSYFRPPSKDGRDFNYYDSCVDSEKDPNVFVVSEKHQIYPEYVLQYKTKDPFEALYAAAKAQTVTMIGPNLSAGSTASAPAAPKPQVAAKPVQAPPAAVTTAAASTPVVSPSPASTPSPVVSQSPASTPSPV